MLFDRPIKTRVLAAVTRGRPGFQICRGACFAWYLVYRDEVRARWGCAVFKWSSSEDAERAGCCNFCGICECACYRPGLAGLMKCHLCQMRTSEGRQMTPGSGSAPGSPQASWTGTRFVFFHLHANKLPMHQCTSVIVGIKGTAEGLTQYVTSQHCQWSSPSEQGLAIGVSHQIVVCLHYVWCSLAGHVSTRGARTTFVVPGWLTSDSSWSTLDANTQAMINSERTQLTA